MANQTQIVSTKTKIVIFVLFEIYALSSAALDYLRYGLSEIDKNPTYDSTLLFIGVFFSVYALVLAWFIEPLFRFLAARAKRENHIFSSEKWKLIFSYLFLYFPAIFGRILLPMGFPFSRYYYFLAATVLFALAWSIRDLRKSLPTRDPSKTNIK
ncbi:MAG: hypothetical protein AB1607_13335 [Chloroflexota bacterium]